MIVIFDHFYFSKEYYKREKADIISAQFIVNHWEMIWRGNQKTIRKIISEKYYKDDILI